MPETTYLNEHRAPTEPNLKTQLHQAVEKVSVEVLEDNGQRIKELFQHQPLKFDIKVGSKTQEITLQLDRVVTFFSKPENKKYLLAIKVNPDLAAKKLKEKIEAALERDVQTFLQLRRTELPIFYFESHFEILELELTNPGTAIQEALEYIMEMHRARTERAGKKHLPLHKRLFYRTTSLLLNASHRLTRYFKPETESGADEAAIKVFLKLVERFWINQVGRPKYNKGIGDADDYWTFPKQGDEVLRKKGFYPLSIRPNPEKHQYRNNHETVATAIWSTLREQILNRQKAVKRGESVTPLPIRKQEGYWVVVESDPRSNKYFRKIHIPHEVLLGENANFIDFYHHYLTEITTNRAPLISGPESYQAVNEQIDEDVFYDSNEHKKNRRNPDNFEDADLRIAIDTLGSGSTKITRYFQEPKYNPMGTRTPTVLVLSVFRNGSSIGQATTINAHAPVDGKRAEEELKKIMKEMESARISTDFRSSDKDILKKIAEIKLLEIKLLTHKKTEVFRAISDGDEEAVEDKQHNQEKTALDEGIAAYEAHLGSDYKSDSQTERDAFIDTLLHTFEEDGELNAFFEKQFGNKIDVYALFCWAVCLTLGIEDVHFLEADGNGLTPIALSLPLSLELAAAASKSESIETILRKDRKLVASLVDTIGSFQRQRSRAKRSITPDGKVKIGMGAIETVEVTSGIFRKQLSQLAGVTIPYGRNITTRSLLVSAMAGTKRRSTGFSSQDIRAFGTADNSVYEFGGLGFTDFATGAWRVVLRSGRVDALRSKIEQDDFYFSDEIQKVVKEYCKKSFISVPKTFPLPEQVISAIFTYMLRKNVYFVMGIFTTEYNNYNKQFYQQASSNQVVA